MENSGDGWHRATAKRIGEQVAKRRKEAGMTAQGLAERCKELGVPIHRTTITKIEGGRSRFDLGELLILAAALDVPPILLLYPGLPDEAVEVIPGETVTSWDAYEWATGVAPSLTWSTSPSAGARLVQAVRARAELKRQINQHELSLLTNNGDDRHSRNMRAISASYIAGAGEEIGRLDTVIREAGGTIEDDDA